MESKDKSKPEPKPENKGISVYPLALSYLEKVESKGEELKELLTQRYNFGLEKYGQPLMTEDGRDEVEDLRQEIGDAVMYLSKCLYKKRDIMGVKEMIKILYEMSDIKENKQQKESNNIRLILTRSPTNCVSTAQYVFSSLTDIEYNPSDDNFVMYVEKLDDKVINQFTINTTDLVKISGSIKEVPRITNINKSIDEAVYYIEVRWESGNRHVIVYNNGYIYQSYHTIYKDKDYGYGLTRIKLEEYDKAIFDMLYKNIDVKWYEVFKRLCIPEPLQSEFVNPVLARCVRSWIASRYS